MAAGWKSQMDSLGSHYLAPFCGITTDEPSRITLEGETSLGDMLLGEMAGAAAKSTC